MISNDDSQQTKEQVVCKIKGRPVPRSPRLLNCKDCPNQGLVKDTLSSSADELPKECLAALEQLMNEAAERTKY